MTCPGCDSALVSFEIPVELREYVPEEHPALSICTRCLSLHPPELASTAERDASPAFRRISDSFPTGEAAVPMALVLGLLESLALYRSDIEQLLERVERAGVDPLLVIDRLDRQGSIHPAWDMSRRRHQIEQFLE